MAGSFAQRPVISNTPDSSDLLREFIVKCSHDYVLGIRVSGREVIN